MNNIMDESSLSCTGCGTCTAMCGKNAINIKEEDGFFKAKIDKNSCVNCGQCKKVCYKFIDEVNSYNIYESKVYRTYSTDLSQRRSSSSGGVCGKLVEYALDNGYKVAGVRYNYEKSISEHIVISDKNHMDKLVGSKYIQSDTTGLVKEIKANPKDKYLIIGSPCQIYGFSKFFRNKNNLDNVILVDFFCHGVPSYNLWRKYLKHTLKSDKITKINFRDKTHGWHKFSMKITTKNKIYLKDLNKDLFYHFFLSNVCLNKCCYDCKLRFNKLYSDIRVGDFWGKLCRDDELGSSIYLSNNEVGETLLRKLEGIHYEEVDFKHLIDSQYVEKIHVPLNYDEISKDLSSDKSLNNIYMKHLFTTVMKKKLKPTNIIRNMIPKKVKKLIRR
jgi:coenzyme F420-reducing hydrogenase beta subunit